MREQLPQPARRPGTWPEAAAEEYAAIRAERARLAAWAGAERRRAAAARARSREILDRLRPGDAAST